MRGKDLGENTSEALSGAGLAMERKQVVLVEQQPLSPEDSESETASSSDSYVYSESVGSVSIAGCSETKPSLVLSSPRRRNKQGDLQFLHFTKEMPDVPVQKAWTFIRDHKMMASLVPGLIEEFDFIEGEGGTGSIYIAYYNPKSVKPGEDAFLINKVEVSDEQSKLYVVKCVGGKYMKLYSTYVTYVNVVAHEVDGDRSSVVVWRFEYDLIDPKSPPPLRVKRTYLAAMDLIMERHHAMNRVDRPLVVTQPVVVNVTKRLRVAASQRRLTSADEQEEPEDMSEQRRRRKRKGKGKSNTQQARVNDDEETDRESRVEETPWWIQSTDFRQGDEEEDSTVGSSPFKNPD